MASSDISTATTYAHSSHAASTEHASLGPAVKSDKAFSQWLDCFRWLAALAVVFAHTENRMLVRVMDVPSAQRSALYYLVIFIAGFAHQAVMIFFVLSGYLVGGGLWKEAIRKKSIDLPMYLVKRVSRLTIVLYPALVLIAVLNLIGIWAFHGRHAGIYPSNILQTMGPGSLACNAAFLNTALCGNYGADGALWSLFNEFWYYLAWPLLLCGLLVSPLWKKVGLFATAILLLTGLTMLQFDGSPVGPYMLIWLLGVGVAYMQRPLIPWVSLSATLFLLCSLLVRLLVRLSYENAHPVGLFLIDFLLSAFFANLLLSMKGSANLKLPPGRERNILLASFSFSLYCVHTPILNLCSAVFHHYTGAGWKMIPTHAWEWGIVFGSIAISLIGAFLFSRITEVHTAELRSWLIKRLHMEGAIRKPTIHFPR